MTLQGATAFRRPADLQSSDLPIPFRGRAKEFAAIEPLIALCSSGKLYEVEAWIAEGHAIQCEPPADRKLQRRDTPLQIAVKNGFHSLAAVLLANGYDPNGDYYECLSPAARRRDHGMVDLLLRFGADPKSVDFAEVLETYDRPLMDRFIAAGVDPCARNAVACALRHKGRPLLGFVKSYRERFPGLQRQVDIALLGFVEKGDEKGVMLMLWLGGDPYAVVPESPYPEDADHVSSECAFENALWRRNEKILACLAKRPIPQDRVRDLFRTVAHRSCPEIVKRLLEMGADPNDADEGEPILRGFIESLLWRFGTTDLKEKERGLEALEMVLKAGAKWEMKDLPRFRRSLLDGESTVVVRLLKLLVEYGALSAAELHELTRTGAMKRLLNGFTKPWRDPFAIYVPPPAPVYPVPQPLPQRRGWKRHWAQR